MEKIVSFSRSFLVVLIKINHRKRKCKRYREKRNPGEDLNGKEFLKRNHVDCYFDLKECRERGMGSKDP